jgi:CubicO group peptidase (beta-lactamase class C family)
VYPNSRLSAVVLLTIIGFGFGTPSLLGQGPKGVFPGANWARIATPEDSGYSAAKLEALRSWLKTQQTKALHVSIDGRVLFEYGDVNYVSKIASMRKSVLGMLYGNYVDKGKVDLLRTVKDIGIKEVREFLPIEEKATLEMLLMSRSGIYQFSNEDPVNQPPRNGSQYPGSFFCYQNWDFDAAGAAFELLTGKNIYDALETDLARPVSMQDFDRARQKKGTGQFNPEFPMYLSTRDMARLGLLMLRAGDLNGKRLLPENWIKYLTTLVTPANDLFPMPFKVAQISGPTRWGFGVAWWVWDQPRLPGDLAAGPFYGAYSANGSGGQYLWVLPELDMVISHKVEIEGDSPGDVSLVDFSTIVQMIISAHCGDSCHQLR